MKRVSRRATVRKTDSNSEFTVDVLLHNAPVMSGNDDGDPANQTIGTVTDIQDGFVLEVNDVLVVDGVQYRVKVPTQNTGYNIIDMDHVLLSKMT